MRETGKYKLPLWDLEDMLKRADLNAVSEKGEAALAGLDTDLSRAVFRSGSTLTTRTGSSISIPATQISGRVQLAAGSYTGTGAYGTSGRNRLSFAFAPKLLIVCLGDGLRFNYQTYGGAAFENSFIWSAGSTRMYVFGENKSTRTRFIDMVYVQPSGYAISWYSESSEASQLNEQGAVYQYLAIG